MAINTYRPYRPLDGSASDPTQQLQLRTGGNTPYAVSRPRVVSTPTPPTTTTAIPPVSTNTPPGTTGFQVPPMSTPLPPAQSRNRYANLRTGGPLPATPVPTVALPPTGGPTPPATGGPPVSVPPTGGPLPPSVTPALPPTGGPNPPAQGGVQLPPTGGPNPPAQGGVPPTGGPNPPATGGGNSFVVPPLTDLGGFDPINGQDFVAQSTPGQQGQQTNPGDVVQQYLSSLLDRNGAYMRNARRRGMETANNRGLMNSSLAAGASERSAIESAQPFVSEAMGLHRQREQLAFQGEESALNRIQGVNDALLNSKLQLRQLQASGNVDRENMVAQMQLQANISQLQAQQDFEFRRTLQSDSTMQQDWLRSRGFNEEFNAQLSMMPVTSSMQYLQALAQMAAQDPEVYTPEVMSGMTNFFNNTMLQLLSNYFPNRVQGGS